MSLSVKLKGSEIIFNTYSFFISFLFLNISFDKSCCYHQYTNCSFLFSRNRSICRPGLERQVFRTEYKKKTFSLTSNFTEGFSETDRILACMSVVSKARETCIRGEYIRNVQQKGIVVHGENTTYF